MAGLEESDEVEDVGVGAVWGGGEGFDGFRGGGAAHEEGLVGFFEGAGIFFGEAAALEADEVDAAGGGWVAVDDGEGGDVLDDFGATSGDGVAADAAELVDGGEAAEDDVVFDDDVSCEGAVVGEDDVIADDAVVGDVGVGEEVAVVADDGFFAGERAAVYGAEFAEDVVGADFEERGFAVVFEVLGLLADGAEAVEAVAWADVGGAHEGDVVLEVAVVAEDDVVTDDAVGADDDIAADFGAWGDDGGVVDGRHGAGGF